MSKNLVSRIWTSLVLMIVFLFFLFINKILWTYMVIAGSIICFFEFNNLIKKIFKSKKNKFLLFNILSLLYLSLFIYIGHDIYKSPPLNLLFYLLICVFSDIGGYIVGNLIGGKKLTKISPNKTISGSIGSFLFSIGPILVYFLIYAVIQNEEFVLGKLNLLILICLFLSLVCQIGDLFFSYIKRLANVKDTGSFLPGHGGLLDRVDGVIFVLPFAYVIDTLFYLR